MDIRANADKRRADYERQIHALSYEREQHEKRIAAITPMLDELHGAVGEIDYLLRDLKTQTAIEAAQNGDDYSAVMMTAEENTNA